MSRQKSVFHAYAKRRETPVENDRYCLERRQRSAIPLRLSRSQCANAPLRLKKRVSFRTPPVSQQRSENEVRVLLIALRRDSVAW